MDLFIRLAQSVASLVIVYVLALYLKKRGVLRDEHSLTLASIVTDLCLPAVVFVNLASFSLRVDHLAPALCMLTAELCCIALAWGLCAMLRMSRATTGAVVFCSAFGSSTFLGYAIVMELYPNIPSAMTEAVLISEIGVGYPIFILGPLLAAHFGVDSSNTEKGKAGTIKDSLAFFRSPVFFALLIGLVWKPLGLPGENSTYMAPLFQVCHILSQALTPLAILSVGLMFRVPQIRTVLVALGIVVGIKLLLKPVALGYFADFFSFPKLWRDVLVLLGAMPPAVLGAVFLRRYGGDASLASTLLLCGTILSCLSILGVFVLVG